MNTSTISAKNESCQVLTSVAVVCCVRLFLPLYCGVWMEESILKTKSTCWFRLTASWFHTHSSSHVIKWKTFISTFIKVILFYIKSSPPPLFFCPTFAVNFTHTQRKNELHEMGERVLGGREARGTKKKKYPNKKTIQEIYENHSTSLISAIYIFTKGEYNNYHGFIWNNIIMHNVCSNTSIANQQAGSPGRGPESDRFVYRKK